MQKIIIRMIYRFYTVLCVALVVCSCQAPSFNDKQKTDEDKPQSPSNSEQDGSSKSGDSDRGDGAGNGANGGNGSTGGSSGGTNGDPNVDTGSHTGTPVNRSEIFTQRSDRKLDILWIIDSSGSMKEEQDF